FKCLSLGASDYIPKPESTREASAAEIFHHDLIQKIRHLGAKLRRAAASTGGPQALMALIAELGPVIDRYPVLITQHMPPTFTTILAEHLARTSKRPAHEAIDGEAIK